MSSSFDAHRALEELHGTAQALSSRSGEPDVIEVLLERALAAMAGRRACLHLLSPDGLELLPAGDCTARGVGRVPAAPVRVADCPLFGQVCRGEVVVIRELERLADPLLSALADEEGDVAVVAAVLAARDHPLGMLVIVVDPSVVLGAEDRLTLHILADLAAIALEKTRQQQSLLSIAEALNSTLEVAPMLERVLEATVRNLWLKAASVRLLDRNRRHLELAAAHGVSPSYRGRVLVELESSPIDRRALQGDAVVLTAEDPDGDLPFPAEMAREGIRSVLAIPLRQKERPVGVIRVYSAQQRHFGAVAVHFLTSVANLLALALENVQLYRAMRDHCRDLELDLAEWHRFLALG